MTQEDAVKHWQREAKGSLTMAKAGLREGEYGMALFHCHLAIEKALKAAYMQKHDEDHPYTHDLLEIALLLKKEWTPAQKKIFLELTDYAIAARYSDPAWAERHATESNTRKWVDVTERFLATFLP